MTDPLLELSTKDGRFAVEAFQFLFEALDDSMRLAGKQEAEGPERHLTGQEVLAGMGALARRAFGPMAGAVWRMWGIQSSLDWGHVVFLLVEANMLASRPEDSLDDFRDGFDFDVEFADEFEIAIPTELGKDNA